MLVKEMQSLGMDVHVGSGGEEGELLTKAQEQLDAGRPALPAFGSEDDLGEEYDDSEKEATKKKVAENLASLFDEEE